MRVKRREGKEGKIEEIKDERGKRIKEKKDECIERRWTGGKRRGRGQAR